MTMLGMRIKLPLVFLLFLLFLEEATSLKCHKCINLDCPQSHPFLCDDAKHFVLQRLDIIYYSYGSRVPFCPAPHDEDGWSNLAATSETCGEETPGEASCSLGRFRVITTVMDTKENISSLGTSFGCSKRRLLEISKLATRINECSMVMGESVVRNSLRHFLEIEHCFIESEMCRGSDFCISSSKSVVKKFRDDAENEGSSIPIGLIIAGILLLGIIVGVLFLLGIKYDV